MIASRTPCRVMPFTMADLTVFETGLDTVPNYLSTGYIVLLVSALALVAGGLAFLFWRGPRSRRPPRVRLLTGAAALAVSSLLMGGCCALAFAVGDLSHQFANLAFAYEDYGFSYCFLQTWLNRGIRRPAGYSQAAVERIVRTVVRREGFHAEDDAPGAGVERVLRHHPDEARGARQGFLDGADGARFKGIFARFPELDFVADAHLVGVFLRNGNGAAHGVGVQSVFRDVQQVPVEQLCIAEG